jgi:hypothetical protein
MFKSFYMAGFECTTGRNDKGDRLDQVAATEHDKRVEADYELLAAVGIHTVREGVRWPFIDRRGGFDFSTLDPFLAAARRLDVEVIWDLFHFGYPDRLDPFAPEFPLEFARYAAAAARHVSSQMGGPYYFTPVNEGSYFAWAGGEVGRFGPHAIGRGAELKASLARAAILGTRAIRRVCPGARFVTADPVCHVVAPHGADPSALERAQHFNRNAVFEFMDMLAGVVRPDLGGSRETLDLVGINYYATNQWELGRDGEPLSENDPRRLPFAALVRRTASRYGGEVLITETANRDDARGAWIDELSSTVDALLRDGVPLVGACLYPVLGMPEWHEPEKWSRMGLWDLVPSQHGLERVPHVPSLRALSRAQVDLRCTAASLRPFGARSAGTH